MSVWGNGQEQIWKGCASKNLEDNSNKKEKKKVEMSR